jgi:hypothetical protein
MERKDGVSWERWNRLSDKSDYVENCIECYIAIEGHRNKFKDNSVKLEKMKLLIPRKIKLV